MIFLFPKTLYSHAVVVDRPKKPNPKPNTPIFCKSDYQIERGLEFGIGDTFFRHESATGRDLGVLAAALHKKSNGGSLRVLDAMCGCGIRSLRYLVESKADFVLANDANDDHRRVVLSNLSRVSRGSAEERRWVVTNNDANRVMTECYLQRDYYDFIDVDSFGSDSTYLRSAFGALKFGGLLYITSTDGYTSGGHRPHQWVFCFGFNFSSCSSSVPLINVSWVNTWAQGNILPHLSELYNHYSLGEIQFEYIRTSNFSKKIEIINLSNYN